MFEFINLNGVFDTSWQKNANMTNFFHFWKEEEGNFILTISVPGIKKKDLSLKIKKDEFIIVNGKTGDNSINKEYLLPEDAKTDKLSAKLEDGILTIQVPKERNEKKVEIE